MTQNGNHYGSRRAPAQLVSAPFRGFDTLGTQLKNANVSQVTRRVFLGFVSWSPLGMALPTMMSAAGCTAVNINGSPTPPKTPGAAQTAAHVKATLVYTNQYSTRNRPCTPLLEERLVTAVDATYGPECEIQIYSGGQDRKGVGPNRLGSIRHDDYGSGGRAADVHVFDPDGQQIVALDLARLGQFWLAANFGSVGHEMRGGGIHLDEWVSPPPGGGRYWTYPASDVTDWGATAIAMLAHGAAGHFP
jgi:hypothetical protein